MTRPLPSPMRRGAAGKGAQGARQPSRKERRSFPEAFEQLAASTVSRRPPRPERASARRLEREAEDAERATAYRLGFSLGPAHGQRQQQRPHPHAVCSWGVPAPAPPPIYAGASSSGLPTRPPPLHTASLPGRNARPNPAQGRREPTVGSRRLLCPAIPPPPLPTPSVVQDLVQYIHSSQLIFICQCVYCSVSGRQKPGRSLRLKQIPQLTDCRCLSHLPRAFY